MSITQITDHVDRAIARLLEQYKGKTGVEGLLSALVRPAQAIEDAYQPLLTQRDVNTALGVQLDGVGSIIGVARQPGQGDEEYRLDIKGQIVRNLSEGTPEEVIAAARFFLETDIIYYSEVYPAEVDIQSSVVVAEELRAALRAQLDAFLPAGVSLGVLGTYDPDNAFIFDGGEGLGEDDDSAGGLLTDDF